MKNPKNILITGASSGLGAALACAYANTGVTLFLHGRDVVRLDAVARACESRGAKVVQGVFDVRDAPGCAEWIRACDKRAPLDLVIANAGISGGSAGLEGHEPIAQARTIFDVNVTGVLNTIEPALTGMIARKRGQIALVSSMASFLALPGAPAYATSKATLRIYGEALGPQLARQGVQMCVVCPGFIKTPMTDVNTYPMPFIMSADAAAQRIVTGLAVRKTRLVFPRRLYALTALVAALPFALQQKLLACAPAKKSL